MFAVEQRWCRLRTLLPWLQRAVAAARGRC